MKERLTQYIDLLFAGAPGCEDIKEEILQNTLDRYDDLIAQGKAPEAAYSLAISGIGDISEILNGCSQANMTPPPNTETAQNSPSQDRKTSAIHKAIALAFFILCPVPLLILENVMGLCLLLVMVAAGVGLLVLFGKENSDKHTDEHDRPTANKGVKGVLWGCGLAIYLFVSFYTGAWYITWLIFPIIACGCGFVDACFDLNKVFVSAFIRAVIFGIAISLMLLVLLGSCLSADIANHVIGESTLVGGEVASVGSVSAKEVTDIEIQWVSGSITIQEADVSDIQFSETSGLSEQHQMVWKQSGDKLIIEFCKPSLFNFHVPSKDLVVSVPQDWTCDELDIDSVSAKIEVYDLHAQASDIVTVSGECELLNCMIMDFGADTVSGKVYFQGHSDSLELSSVSADCTVSLLNFQNIDLDTVSGDMILYLPDLKGFTATLDTVSGEFTSELATTSSGNTYQYGDGSGRINTNSVSGDILIRPSR